MANDSSPRDWADGPLNLIAIPSSSKEHGSHVAVHCASEMAHSHNCFLRALNSILKQAPMIPDATNEGYNKKDVEDLMTFTHSWVKVVRHHHHTEETCIFPGIEKLAQRPDLFEGSREEHNEFTSGLEMLQTYVQETDPNDYRWEGVGGMKTIIDGFTEPLARHLKEEIDLIVELKSLDEADLSKAWKEGEKVAAATGNIGMLYDVFPLVLGCADRTYSGGNSWPPLPSVLNYAMKYWFSRRFSGAWRFNTCDWWGNPIPLHFIPDNMGTDHQNNRAKTR